MNFLVDPNKEYEIIVVYNGNTKTFKEKVSGEDQKIKLLLNEN